MNDATFRFYHDAIEARREAHFVMRSKLPGWRIHARAALRRAIIKWQDYAKARRLHDDQLPVSGY
ncbi:hypothetical protein [Mesorhizobium sp. Root157]|uniref:hypothetical protein n=1 Tax=Mesorhizobium sp. Root157 TaxID=1736477 RepID=UPI00138F232A|nr:hypothetical protein [Mesorhizobium sp. Root157]